MPPFAGRRRPDWNRFHRSKRFGRLGVNQWSVARQAQIRPNASNEPAARKAPTKRASYAGHELSVSDVVADFDSDSEYWPDDDDDDDDDNSFSQMAAARVEAKKAEDADHLSCSEHTGRTKMTSMTGELTCATNTSTSSQQAALPVPTLRRRVSAPPVLIGITVETPSPPSSPPPPPSPPSSPSEGMSNNSFHTSADEDDDDYTTSPIANSDRLSSRPRTGPASNLSLPASPASPRSATDHRSVRFNPRVRFYLHLHLNDNTDAELTASYINEDDTSRIQRDIVDSIVRMHADHHQEPQNEDEDDHQHCPRGLEHLSNPASASALRNARIHHTDAVLDEQDRQFLRGINDEERLATASTEFAEDAVARAINLGAADADFVQQFVRPEVQEEEGEEEVVGASEPSSPSEGLSSVLQAAMNISSSQLTTSTTGTTSDTPSMSRVGSRDRLLNILGHLQSGLEEARSEGDQMSQVVQRHSRRRASSSSSSSTGNDEANADLPEDRSEPST